VPPDACADLPFDQYQRYRLVADVLQRIREGAHGGKPLRVLDVGGRTALLRRFLPEDHVFLVDVEASEEEGLVLGDGSRLPYKEGSFDAVATFDTLEHVPPAGREAFLAECRRVSRSWVIVAGPYDTPRVADAEVELREFLTHKLETKHRYLDEHHENGLPSLDATEAKLRELGGKVHSVAHGNIDRWLAMMCLSFYMDRDAPLREIAARFHRFYNESLYASDHAAPVYRHAVVASFAGHEPSQLAPRFEVPVAPPEAMERVRHFANELLQFDVKRDVFEKERARLTAVNDGLVTDLEQHGTKLSELQELYEERGSVLDELREEERELKAGLAKVRGEIAEIQLQSGKVIDTLRVDLAGHTDQVLDLSRELELAEEALKSSLAARETDAALLRSEIAAHEKVQSELQAQLTDQANHVNALNAELTSTRAAATEMEKQLAQLNEDAVSHNATIVELHEEIGRRGEALEAHQGALEAERAERERLLGQMQAESEAAKASLDEAAAEAEAAAAAGAAREAELEARLAGLEAHIESMRLVVNSRVQSLGRAFAFRKKRL
ncbi:MAG: methyltransferase domain-containing protein, partial [Planctomycetota bacterium]